MILASTFVFLHSRVLCAAHSITINVIKHYSLRRSPSNSKLKAQHILSLPTPTTKADLKRCHSLGHLLHNLRLD